MRDPTPLDIGISAHRRGDLDAAEEAYSSILKASPEHPDARHLLGVLLLQKGRMAEAEREIRRALRQRPNDGVFHSNLGEALRLQGRLREAEEVLRRALSLSPRQADAHNNLGLVLLACGRADEAVAQLRKAAQLEPGSPETLANLANALRAAGHHEEAVDLLRTLIERIPSFGEARLMLCRLLIDEGRRDDARHLVHEGLESQPEDAPTRAAAALVALADGDYAESIEHARAAVELHGLSPGAAISCASVFVSTGHYAEAASLLERVEQSAPGQIDVLEMLALASLKIDDLERSHAACLRILEARPKSVDAHLAMARVLRQLERMDEAEQHIEMAGRFDPQRADVIIESADLARHRYDADRARQILKAGLERFPQNTILRERLAVASMEAGDILSSQQILRELIAMDPDHIPGYYWLGRIRGASEEDRDMVEGLVARLESGMMPPLKAGDGHFAAAKLLDDLDEPARAFAHYCTANSLRQAATLYNRRDHEEEIEARIHAYSQERIEKLQAYGSESRTPIIIAGMPRSGTTLVEQILASHPRVAAAGEIDIFARLRPGPQQSLLAPALDALDREQVRQMADACLARMRRDGARAERVTDKTPRNFMALGLAAVLFPRASIVHCRREPLDTCLSIYFTDLEVGYEYAFDFDDIAHYFSCYRRIMEHWESVLPARILHVDYEALVSDFESECRRLLNFCGLEWDRRCVDFHRQKRTVLTASVWQVRQPIYTSSKQRWRRYGDDVAPLRAALTNYGIEVPTE